MQYHFYKVNPEIQESPFELYNENFDFEFYNVWGNNEFKSFISPFFDEILENADNAGNELNELNIYGKDEISTTKTETINYYFTKKNKRNFSPKEISIMNECCIDIFLNKTNLHKGWNLEIADSIAKIMSIISGEKWEYTQIYGCCQGDVNILFYNSNDFTEKDIRNIETEYFNLGEEYSMSEQCDPDEFIHNLQEDIYGFYVHEWEEEEKKKELASYVDCDIKDVYIHD